MNRPLLIICILLAMQGAVAQDTLSYQYLNRNAKDSLLQIIGRGKGDTNEVRSLAEMAMIIESPDSGIQYGERGISLAKSLNDERGEGACLFSCAFRFAADLGNPIQVIIYSLNALAIFEKLPDYRGVTETKLLLQATYRDLEDYDNSLVYGISGERLSDSLQIVSTYNFPGHRLAPLFSAELAATYLEKNLLDSSMLYVQKAIHQNEFFEGVPWSFPYYLLGRIQTRLGNYAAAGETYRSKALPLTLGNKFYKDTLQIFRGLAELDLKTGKLDSAIGYAKTVVRQRYDGETSYTLDAIGILVEAYKQKGLKDSILRYMEFRDFYQDSLQNNKKLREIQNLAFNRQLKQQEVLSAELRYKERLRFYLTASGLLIILLVAILLWRHNRHRKKAYVLLELQKKQTEEQKTKTEQALIELKNTQTQLIQSEKMASLGELTAGIAHEIQNPLNFVNNFSEVNIELTGELEEEMDKGNLDKAKAIAKDIRDNEEKINQHGQRADAIVKSMLQHSRANTGQKESADINKMILETLNLSYQGFRSKDKIFKAAIQTVLDERVENIQVVPQDIGRVLLNLFNNAFYSVSERNRKQVDGYEPTIRVSSKKSATKIDVRVWDNGKGIPAGVLDKIFQPFFTTKPAGQGTGLGLSLSYDIMKSHGGEIRVDSKEGQYTEFVLIFPLT